VRKNSFVNFALTAVSAFILTVASVAGAVPCVVFYHQPKFPQDMKARMAAMRGGEIIAGNC